MCTVTKDIVVFVKYNSSAGTETNCLIEKWKRTIFQLQHSCTHSLIDTFCDFFGLQTLLKPEILPNWYHFFLNKSYQLRKSTLLIRSDDYCYEILVPKSWDLMMIDFPIRLIRLGSHSCYIIKWTCFYS